MNTTALLDYVRAKYQSSYARIVKLEPNPHIGAGRTSGYEIDAFCHPACRYEQIATVEYDPRGYAALVGVTTCGAFAVWMD